MFIGAFSPLPAPTKTGVPSCVVGWAAARSVAVTMAFPRTACQTHSPRPRRALELETCAVVRRVYALSDFAC